jgi:hypothetical protein
MRQMTIYPIACLRGTQNERAAGNKSWYVARMIFRRAQLLIVTSRNADFRDRAQ